ncbi:glutamine synthetase family protein [Microbacterium capsulatum]|uniref:Glutamine synthetase family protein n=1 Tax=Microbacterium capsulatum TaxID=3041921 RepID=A0ABU0XII2_9MICO|nr:glutamine synthetase family protein [Microbacterium sp. ASV81]MDQ4214937.1 glutamine synthetase family protein [Microbacterium sp. ASV81]
MTTPAVNTSAAPASTVTAGEPDALDARVRSLREAGVDLLVGTALDFAGVIRSKAVPVRRLPGFASSGMGASPSWVVFCADNGIAFTSGIGVSGDLRLRLDAAAVRPIGDGMAWGPTGYHEQSGERSPLCARGRLADLEERVAAAGLTALMGAELEFTLVAADGSRLEQSSWAAYGMRSLVARRDFLTDLTRTLEEAQVGAEQIHAEYGTDQFEVSLAPLPPVEMADTAILTRILIGLVAARHGLAPSFSPLSFVGGSGNGMHLHLSLARDGQNLFGAGDGPHGITAEGGSAIGGVLDGLSELLAVYAGSVVSSLRLTPGSWSGAAACWGLENREAALRFLAGTPGNPHGANIELKIVDPSANLYLAAAAFLGSALDGIERGLPLPEEVVGNPAETPEFTRLRLDAEPSAALDRLASSALAQELFGAGIVEGAVAVRRHELDAFAGAAPEEITAALRLAWT